jgi:hypothetical protein
MSTRKAPPGGEESVNKRRRVLCQTKSTFMNVAGGNVAPACFDRLNNDCLVHIMSFQSIEDMNTVALYSQARRQAGKNESLDQKRIATIVCNRLTTNTSLFAKLSQASTVLNPNYTHLKIVEESLGEYDARDIGLPIQPIDHVTTLELSANFCVFSPPSILSKFLPNIRELIVDARDVSQLSSFCQNLGKLSRVLWRQGEVRMDGYELRHADNLTPNLFLMELS